MGISGLASDTLRLAETLPPARSAWRLRVWLVAMLLMVLFVATTGRRVAGQPTDQPAVPLGEDNAHPPSPAAVPERRMSLQDRCSSCHERNLFPAFDGYVRFDEWTTWKCTDKHARAFAVLRDERSQAMAAALGLPVDHPEKWTSCLGCHSNVTDPAQPHDLLTLEEGVSCLVCHGDGPWTGEHAGAGAGGKAFYLLTTEAKWREFGLVPLRFPEVKSATCVSCHVGNAEENKIITHEMYAAGHPPLPSFELVNFCEAMPRHWDTLSEQFERARTDTKLRETLATLLDPEREPELARFDTELEQTTIVMRNALVMLRESAKLLAAEIRLGEDGPSSTGWPQVAQFDCYACHHELERPSWRQQRGYRHAPGRPPLRMWTAALAPIVTRAVVNPAAESGHRDLLSPALEELQAAATVRPFGDPARLTQAADKLVEIADRELAIVRQTRIDREVAIRLLNQIQQRAAEHLVDYEEARQLAWAFRAVLAELEPATRQSTELAHLADLLHLDLTPGKQDGIESRFGDALGRIEAYDPTVFQAALAATAPLIPDK